jgi:hypothetical protein
MSEPDSFFTVTLKSNDDFGEPLSTGNFGVAVSLAASGAASVTAIARSDLALSPSACSVSL